MCVDEQAKRHLRRTLNRLTHSPLDKSHPDELISSSVYCNNGRIFENHLSNLYDIISNQRLVGYWGRIGHFSARYQEQISWKAVDKTSSHLSSAKIFVSKWVSEECGVRTSLRNWEHRYEWMFP